MICKVNCVTIHPKVNVLVTLNYSRMCLRLFSRTLFSRAIITWKDNRLPRRAVEVSVIHKVSPTQYAAGVELEYQLQFFYWLVFCHSGGISIVSFYVGNEMKSWKQRQVGRICHLPASIPFRSSLSVEETNFYGATESLKIIVHINWPPYFEFCVSRVALLLDSCHV